MTSAPWAAAPRPNAAGQSGRGQPHVVGGHHGRGTGQPDERGPDGLDDVLVELVRDDAADVVRLEDLPVLGHLPASHAAAAAAVAACTGTEPTGRSPARDGSAGSRAAVPAARRASWQRPVSPGGRRRTARTAAPAGGRGGRSPRPGRPARRGCSAPSPRGPRWPAPRGHRGRLGLGLVFLRGGGQPDHVPAARHGQPVRVPGAQVVAVRLHVGGQRAEHRRGVAVDIGQRVHGDLLAGRPRTGPRTHLSARAARHPAAGCPCCPCSRTSLTTADGIYRAAGNATTWGTLHDRVSEATSEAARPAVGYAQ